MGIFDKIVGNKNGEGQEHNKADWKMLTSISQLNDVAEASRQQKVIIFKHSTRCTISASVLSKFEKRIPSGYQIFLLDLIAHRDVSLAIAEKFDVIHQSPQVVFLEEGKVIQHSSHYDILDSTF